jgi:hypothetical protein
VCFRLWRDRSDSNLKPCSAFPFQCPTSNPNCANSHLSIASPFCTQTHSLWQPPPLRTAAPPLKNGSPSRRSTRSHRHHANIFCQKPTSVVSNGGSAIRTAHPTPNNGQKYFHLLQKLSAEIMSNCRVPHQIHTATAMSFSHGSGLMFLRDSYNQLNFLVDSGASLSIIPFSSSQTPLGPKLLGANGQHSHLGISSKNYQNWTSQFEHEFLLAKVAIPILGLDFFRKFQLSIHPLQCHVMDKAGQPISAIFAAVADKPPQQEVRSLPRSVAAADRAPAAPTKEVRQPLSTAADMAAQTPLQEVSMSIPEPVRRLLAKYPSIIRSETLTPTPTHGVEHVIDTGGNRPVFAKARRLTPDKLRITEAEFKKLEAAGIIRMSNSAWASPFHMVAKKDGSWQPCGDYRRLNTVTTPRQVPPAEHAGPRQWPRRMHRLQQDGPRQRIPPGTHCHRQHPQNRHHHAIWSV